MTRNRKSGIDDLSGAEKPHWYAICVNDYSLTKDAAGKVT